MNENVSGKIIDIKKLEKGMKENCEKNYKILSNNFNNDKGNPYKCRKDEHCECNFYDVNCIGNVITRDKAKFDFI